MTHSQDVDVLIWETTESKSSHQSSICKECLQLSKEDDQWWCSWKDTGRVAAPEFFGCWGTARTPEFRLVHLQKLCITSLFLVEASSYTVRTNGSVHGRKIVFCEKMVVHSCRKPG